ncbi:hypothetical protein M409DRAFT_64160 [Zasmidium cellare ATCC 36951]|uniref:UBX domain-containing protein 2 n=1 Tax=Zasmidium cellare ATCC 36951 TaxID=1080233 RepID=A0A6A6CW38_ZASCE|nr:uncharacterized protein M409DRAFT_64160 [Zasmidium cellare ATCC 36951]KAF2170410.1 hypothetical protein M409DRAFT_64160 [Zasmidium cellare ATCC 36951]
MFHDGDLQSGISRAIAEQKLVACFVRQDDNEESRIWEEEWLGQKPHPSSSEAWSGGMGDVFATKAVLLRIEYGSQEANFLNAFCPVTKAPTFAIIRNGEVLDKLEGGLGKQEFVERVSKALGIEVSFMTRQEYHERREEQGNRSTNEVVDAENLREESASQSHAAHADADHVASSHSSEIAPQHVSQANMSNLFPDRAQRLEVEKAKREAAEKAEKAARANARKKEAEEAHAFHKGDKGKGKEPSEAVEKEKARRDWLVQQKQRKDDAKRERERILAQIEADKQERKARSQRAPEGPSEPLPPSADAASRRRMGAGGMCNLAIRLFDGSSIKGRFEPSSTLATGVRDWIKETAAGEGAADIPFTFKQILAPQPSRSIEISEEHQSLQELGVVPNATLVLVPVSGYTEAYTSSGGRGYMSTALHAAYGVVNTATGLVSSVISHIPGLGGRDGTGSEAASTSTEDTAVRTSTESGASSFKVKTMADQRAETARKQDQKNEFYNGNSSAFEGRKDDQDEKK